MANTLVIKYSDTPAATPTLTLGEIAINRADGKLFWLNSSNVLQSMLLGNAIAALLTGFSAGSGTVAATDTILQAINKIVGNQALKANLASPTFTGTVVLPSTTSIGGITNTELSYIDGVTSAIQTQLDAKAALASPTFTGTPAGPTAAAGTNTTQLATTAFITGAKAPQTLTDGATITWSITAGFNAKVTLAGNRTLAITNAVAGDYGTLVVTQDGTGSRTLALPAGSKVISGGTGAVTLTTTAAAKDILCFFYDGTSYYWTIGKNYT